MRVLIFVVLSLVIASQQTDNDEGRPYEFGFTIDGQQHRHERKDQNGIIQGEFGFITADGVYHVTVYATDENGNFKILSMKNIRISAPLDGSPATGPISPDAGKYLNKVNQVNPPPRQQVQQQQPVQSPSAFTRRPSVGFTTQPTIRPACAGCGYITTPKPVPGQTSQFQNQQFLAQYQPQGPVPQKSEVGLMAPGGQGYQNGPSFQSGQGFQGGLSSQSGLGFQGGQSSQSGQGFQGGQISQSGQGFQDGQSSQSGQGLQGGQISQSGQGFQGGQISQSGQSFQSGQSSQTGQGFQSGQSSHSVRGSQIGQSSLNGEGFQGGQSLQSGQGFQGGQSSQRGQGFQSGQSSHSVQGSQIGQSSLNGQGFQSGQSLQSGQGFQGGQSSQTGQGFQGGQSSQTGQGFQSGQSSHSGQGSQIGQSSLNRQGFQGGQSLQTGQGFQSGQSSLNKQGLPGGQGLQSGQSLQNGQNFNNGQFQKPGGQGSFPQPFDYQGSPEYSGSEPFSSVTSPGTGFGNPGVDLSSQQVGMNDGLQRPNVAVGGSVKSQANNRFAASPFANGPNPLISAGELSKLPPISVTDNVIHVGGKNPKDIPIQDKFPGMVAGLPNGVEETDVKNILYKFKYTVGFHGHYEKGLKNGAKVGGYFVNGRDGISRVVTYVADENGYRPKFKFINLGLDSDETPKEGSEKKFGLKSFEFVWYPIE